MADNKSTLKGKADTTQEGTDPKTDDLENGKTFNPSELSDEEFEKVFADERLFKHKRFKQLNERAKKADQLESDLQKQKEKELEEQNKWKELAEERAKKLEATEKAIQAEKISNAIFREATKQGAVDSEAVLKLVDQSGIEITDDGVQGVSEAVKTLLENKPYLTGESSQRTVGQGSNPADGGNTAPKRFKASQLKDPVFYRKHEKEIDKAMELGLITDDLPDA